MSDEMVLKTGQIKRIAAQGQTNVIKHSEPNRSIFDKIDEGLGINWLKENVKKYTGITYFSEKMTEAVDDGDDNHLSLKERLWEGARGVGTAVERMISSRGLAFVGALALGSYAAGLAGIGKLFNVVTKGFFIFQGTKLAVKGTKEFIEADTKEEAHAGATTAATGGIILFGTARSIAKSMKANSNTNPSPSRAHRINPNNNPNNPVNPNNGAGSNGASGSNGPIDPIDGGNNIFTGNGGNTEYPCYEVEAESGGLLHSGIIGLLRGLYQNTIGNFLESSGYDAAAEEAAAAYGSTVAVAEEEVFETSETVAETAIAEVPTTPEAMRLAIESAQDLDTLRSLREGLKGMPIELHRLYVQKEMELRSQLSYGQKVVVNKTNSENESNDGAPALKLVTKEDGTEQYYIAGSPEHPSELLAEERFPDGRIKVYVYDADTDELAETEEILPSGIIKKTDLRPNPDNLEHTDEIYPNGQIIKYTYKKDTRTLVSTEEIYPNKRVIKKTYYNASTFPDQNLLQNIRRVNGITISSGSVVIKTEETSPDGTITEGIILDEIDDTIKILSVTHPNKITKKYSLKLTDGAKVTEECYPDGRVIKYTYCAAAIYPDKEFLQGLNIKDSETLVRIEETRPDRTVVEGLLIPSYGDGTAMIVSETTPDGVVKKYDTNGRVIKEIVPNDCAREYTYDENGTKLLRKETFKDKSYKIYDYIDGKQVVIEEGTSEGLLIKFSPEGNCTETYRIKWDWHEIHVLIKKEIINKDSQEIYTYSDFGNFKEHLIIYPSGDQVYLNENGVIEKAVSVDGTIRTYYNGKIKEESYPDGSYKRYYNEGAILLMVEKLSDGTRKDYYHDGSLREVRYPDGRYIFYNSDGSIYSRIDLDSEGTLIEYKQGILVAKKYTDGSHTEYYSNGTIRYQKFSDGSCTAYYDDGTIKYQIRPDATRIVYYENGAISYQSYTDGSSIEYYENGLTECHVLSDGSTICYYEDGSVKSEKYTNGVTRKYEQGKRHKLRGPDSFFKWVFKSIFNKK